MLYRRSKLSTIQPEPIRDCVRPADRFNRIEVSVGKCESKRILALVYYEKIQNIYWLREC